MCPQNSVTGYWVRSLACISTYSFPFLLSVVYFFILTVLVKKKLWLTRKMCSREDYIAFPKLIQIFAMTQIDQCYPLNALTVVDMFYICTERHGSPQTMCL
jgi:hypothetical protein